MHKFCKLCFKGLFKKVEQAPCPICRQELKKNDFLPLPRITLNPGVVKSSSKIEALQEILSQCAEDEKVIVFSHFLTMLKIIQLLLPKEKASEVR